MALFSFLFSIKGGEFSNLPSFFPKEKGFCRSRSYDTQRSEYDHEIRCMAHFYWVLDFFNENYCIISLRAIVF